MLGYHHISVGGLRSVLLQKQCRWPIVIDSRADWSMGDWCFAPFWDASWMFYHCEAHFPIQNISIQERTLKEPLKSMVVSTPKRCQQLGSGKWHFDTFPRLHFSQTETVCHGCLWSYEEDEPIHTLWSYWSAGHFQTETYLSKRSGNMERWDQKGIRFSMICRCICFFIADSWCLLLVLYS